MRSDGTPRCGPKLPRKVNRVTLIITNEDPAPNSSQGHEMTAIRPIAVVVKVSVAAWRMPRSDEGPQAFASIFCLEAGVCAQHCGTKKKNAQ